MSKEKNVIQESASAFKEAYESVKQEVQEEIQTGNSSKEGKCRTMIGGQALMEGVMMRGKSSMAMAVRAPDGSIMLETSRLQGQKWYNRVPILRGVAAFLQSLVTGVTTLLKSAEVSTPDEDTPSKGWMFFAVVLGVVFAVGLFILLPSALNSLLFDMLINVNVLLGNALGVLISSLFEGLLRIFIFVIYLVLVSKMKDIRRTFMYHGAEHRTINCFEKQLPMTVENVQSCSTRHNRCGTTFLFFVMILSILIFSLCNWLMVVLNFGTNMFIKMGVRIVLLPFVAGLSYELLRGLAVMPDNLAVRIMRAPGLALQRLTTFPPEDEMAEVALKSFLAVYEMDANSSIMPIKFGEYRMSEMKKYSKQFFMQMGLDEREAESETDWILCEVTGLKRSDLHTQTTINLGQYKKLNEFLEGRKAGIPLDYLTGKSEFYGLKLKVNNSVLIPRMETEVLVEHVLQRIGDRALRVADVCTGSGCIAAAIAKNTDATVVATELSESAAAVATENLKDYPNASVIHCDLLSETDGIFDIIVSNPPYIETTECTNLTAEVLAQPRMALDGGEDGLMFYRRLHDEGLPKLADNGAMMMEIGYNQANEVSKIFSDCKVSVIKDLDKNDRVIIAEKV